MRRTPVNNYRITATRPVSATVVASRWAGCNVALNSYHFMLNTRHVMLNLIQYLENWTVNDNQPNRQVVVFGLSLQRMPGNNRWARY
jgi:hypothetical protein